MNTAFAFGTQTDLQIPANSLRLNGDLVVPPNPRGLVLFAHGSGSGRKSSRNRLVARVLQNQSIATLLFDLLTVDEEEIDRQTAQLRFDIPFLAERLIAVTDWIRHEDARHLPIGYFGASTGAAAALIAAAHFRTSVRAVVSRGGRPDLAADHLKQVTAPTLLIVGSRDTAVIEMNRDACQLLICPRELKIVPGASHLFEESNTLQQAAESAADWFDRNFRRA